jgi:hypothetical protein
VPALAAVFVVKFINQRLFPDVCAKAGNGFVAAGIVSSLGLEETIVRKTQLFQ